MSGGTMSCQRAVLVVQVRWPWDVSGESVCVQEGLGKSGSVSTFGRDESTLKWASVHRWRAGTRMSLGACVLPGHRSVYSLLGSDREKRSRLDGRVRSLFSVEGTRLVTWQCDSYRKGWLCAEWRITCLPSLSPFP